MASPQKQRLRLGALFLVALCLVALLAGVCSAEEAQEQQTQQQEVAEEAVPKAEEAEPKAEAEEEPERPQIRQVTVLVPGNFSTSETGIWFIEFYAPWCSFCKNLEPTWNKLAAVVGDRWNVAKLDCTTDPQTTEFCRSRDVTAFPVLNLYKDGKLLGRYAGPRELRPFLDWTKKLVPEMEHIFLPGEQEVSETEQEDIPSDVITLTDDSINEINDGNTWLFAFVTPWCGYCIALAPEYEKFATLVKDRIKVARIDATTNPKAVSLFGVSGVPTIKLVTDGTTFDYLGSRNLEGLEKFVTDNVIAFRPKRELDNVVTYEESGLANLHLGNFEEATKGKDWILYFYLEWCPHCKLTSLIINELAEKNVINIGRINIEKEIELRNRFKAFAVPKAIFLKADGTHEDYSYPINHKYFDLFISQRTVTPPEPKAKEIVAVVADETSFHPDEHHHQPPPPPPPPPAADGGEDAQN